MHHITVTIRPGAPAMDQDTTHSPSRPGSSFRLAIWFLLIWLGWLPAVGAEAAELQSIDYASLPGNRLQFRLRFDQAPPTPASFATESPARLVLDFKDVRVRMRPKTLKVGVGVAGKVTAVEAGKRTRVVFNLNEAVPYEITSEGRTLVVTLEGGSTPTVSRETASGAQAPPSGDWLEGIDFRRGPNGEGRVILTLPHTDTVVQVNERGDHVRLAIDDTRLPERLHQRLDVADFATPVRSITLKPTAQGVQVDIQAAGRYEYLAYQADDRYTVEFRPLTQAQQERIKEERKVYTGQRLSLNFQDIEVRAVLQLLADFTGINMVVSDTVQGNITLRLKNVPWDQALDIILKTKGLSQRTQDNVMLIAPTKEITSREELELASRKKVQELAPLHSEFIQINYAKASDLAALLKSSENRLLSERGQVTVDNRTNTLLIQDTAAKLEDIRRMILKLDVPVRQVLIESRVVIANNDFARDLGVRFGWSGARQLGNDTQVNIGGGLPGHLDGTGIVNKGPFLADVAGNPFDAGITLPNGTDREALMVNLPVDAPSGAANFLIGKIGSYLLQLELSAMQKEGRGEVVSSPRVITSDQNKATIKQGVEIPYQERSSSGATSVAFKEAVLQLDVTPHITPDDRIMMDLKINKDSPDFSRSVLGVPPVDTRSVETSVLVDNGETVVLGGVYERTKTKNKEQVPLLGDIPVLGFFFQKHIDRDENKELLIFVTPKILKQTLIAR